MRWSVHLLAVLLAAALDAGLGGLFEIGSIRASILPSVVVFVALSAPKRIVIRAAMVGGLACDLFAPTVLADGSALVVPGPHILAFALGAAAVIPLRGLLYRQNPVSNAAAVVVFSAFASLMWISISIVRSAVLGSAVPWWPASGVGELLVQLMSALADGVLGLVVFWVLTRTKPIWGFEAKTRLAPGVAREGL
jgi:hypothetical protein